MTTANVPYDKEQFVAAVLQGMGWDPTPFRMNLMREWISGEGTGAGYNPLATTQEGGEDPSDPYWNDNGGNPVKNYRDFNTGVQQTIKTLSNQYYPALRATFETEQIQPGAAENAATWGTMHLANVLSNGGVSGDGAGYSGSYPNSQMQTTPDLPFTQQEFQTKYVRYKTLGDQLANMQADPLTGQFPPEYATLSQEYYSLELELNDYQTAQASGGADINGEIARLKYQNESNPALIDAENSANAWARQQTINQQATSGTQADLNQQRLTADSADASGQAYKNSNHFNQPFGFRVGSTDLPTEEELFAKQVARASANLPEVKPIPYSAPLGAFGKPATPMPAVPSVIPRDAGANPSGTVTGSHALDDDPFASRPLPTAPPLAPAPASGGGRPNPLNAPGLGQQFGSAFGGTALGQLGTMFGGGQNNLNLNNWPDTQAESDTLPPIQAPRPQPLQPSPLVQPFPNTGLRRFAGSILGSRY